jgi:hypothetical protein
MYGFMLYCICSMPHLRVIEYVVLDPVSGLVGLDPRD